MQFTISPDPCALGFQEHVNLNPIKPIATQLQRRILFHRANRTNSGDPHEIKKIIERNASLRINFGWSFESTYFYNVMMNDCITELSPKFLDGIGNMTTDNRCSWLGFVPFNIFEKSIYDNLSTSGLIEFNNELVKFQTAVLEYIVGHQLYLQHAITRDDNYRFAVFKGIRKDPVALSDAYRYYLDAVRDVSLVPSLPREVLEDMIGCHFLYQPDLFFELLEFSILKGEVYDK